MAYLLHFENRGFKGLVLGEEGAHGVLSGAEK